MPTFVAEEKKLNGYAKPKMVRENIVYCMKYNRICISFHKNTIHKYCEFFKNILRIFQWIDIT